MSPTRCVSAAVAAGTTAYLLVRLVAATWPRLSGAAVAPDDVVVVGAAVMGALAAARLALGALLVLADEALRAGGRTRPRLTAAARTVAPAALRRVLAVGVATGIGLAGATGAVAAEPDLGWVVTSGTSPVAAPAGLPRPEPIPAPPAASPPLATPPPSTPEPTPAAEPDPAADTVVVIPGDTLWQLTAERLPGAGAAEIAAAWPAVHEANRAVIGADPDVIHPGQELDLGVLRGRG